MPPATCQCLTSAGVQCTRPAQKDSNRCWQHKNNCKPVSGSSGTATLVPVSKPAPSAIPKSGTSILNLPPDVKRIVANYSNMTIGDIHSLCRSHRAFNEAICEKDVRLKKTLQQVREKLTENYDNIKTKTLTELEDDLALLHNLTSEKEAKLRSKGYELVPHVPSDVDQLTVGQIKVVLTTRYPGIMFHDGRGNPYRRQKLVELYENPNPREGVDYRVNPHRRHVNPL